jgi:hypothetical protein
MIGEASTASNNPIFLADVSLQPAIGVPAAQRRQHVATGHRRSVNGATFGSRLFGPCRPTPLARKRVNVTRDAGYGVVGDSPACGPIPALTRSRRSRCPAITASARHHDGRAPAPSANSSLLAGTDTRMAQLIEGYLGWKWPTLTALNEDHPFVNRPPEIGQ